jgi:hypothetical protein
MFVCGVGWRAMFSRAVFCIKYNTNRDIQSTLASFLNGLTLRWLMSYKYIYMECIFLMFLDHTQRRSTVGRTPLDERSARCRDFYLTTHDAHNRQISMPPGGSRTHDLSRWAATGRSPAQIVRKAQIPYQIEDCDSTFLWRIYSGLLQISQIFGKTSTTNSFLS